MDIILITAIIGILFNLWFWYCNNKTYKQRIERLKSMQYEANWDEQLQDFQSVSYNSHLFSLIIFRNPNRLYKFK